MSHYQSIRLKALSRFRRFLLLAALVFSLPASVNAAQFSEVAAIFGERCLDCHSAPDAEGEFLMETFFSLMKGGQRGPAIVPGNSSKSFLVKMIEGTAEIDGKRMVMPPGKRKKLTPGEIDAIKSWIDAGAVAPSPNSAIAKTIEVPRIAPKVPPKRAIYSLAFAPKGNLLAVGRMGSVELFSAESQALVRTLSGPEGTDHSSVNGVVFSPDGKTLFAVGGSPGVKGEIRRWTMADGSLLRTIPAHGDAIYGLAISPDGKLLATGSYDQKIKIWDAESGVEIRTLTGHNGCVFGLSFRADGRILASASGDRTIKLWDVATGARLDTLSQPLKEQYAVAFSPDGRFLAAAGVDNRIRVWEISEQAKETTNPLLHSKFAHEGAILNLTFSADGKTLLSTGEDRLVKLWNFAAMQERRVLERRIEWSPAIAFLSGDKEVAVGGLDGSLAFYDTQSGSVLHPPRPEISRVEPRGVQRGTETKLKLHGKNLGTVSGVRASNPGIHAELGSDGDPAASSSAVWIKLKLEPGIARGMYELVLVSPQRESLPAKFYIDDLPQLVDAETTTAQILTNLPVTVWGNHPRSGDREVYEFQAEAGETLVFDIAAKSLGSKSDLVLTLSDKNGRILETNKRFDKSGDPLIGYSFTNSGPYRLAVSELELAGSPDHFYRLSIGKFAFVTGVYPPVVQASHPVRVRLLGYNLTPAGQDCAVTATDGKEERLQLDPEHFRWRGNLSIRLSDLPISLEEEPNDSWKTATPLSSPGIAAGRISDQDKEDWFRFEARAGQSWVLETAADQLGSPLDTQLEVRDSEGKPVLSTLLQAVRASAITFRGIDSTTVDCRVENWEEMDLNQYLYLQSEVVRLFRAPQGPDSGFNFYASNGKRRNYWNTTASAHANAEPCYIVEPHRPGATLAANGLPTFPIFFENDDDGERRLGTDSRIYFAAPRDGVFFARVRDARGFGGDRFCYTLTLREAHPDFRITVEGINPVVSKGSGQRFVLNAERIDGFEGGIKVEIHGLPEGLRISTPVTIQEGLTAAFGTVFVTSNATHLTKEQLNGIKLIASAEINGKTVTHDAGTLGTVSISESAPLYVELSAPEKQPTEILVAPGANAPAVIKLRRNGHNDLVTFQVENLPHGVIVENIGLNGVLIPKDQNEREIFISAQKWVPETEAYCYAVSNEAGRQTSEPILIKVRKAAAGVAVK